MPTTAADGQHRPARQAGERAATAQPLAAVTGGDAR